MSKQNLSETNRNIELLARVLNGEQITKQQAADFYNVEEITISRALQYYRSLGIEAFGRKSGIIIQNRPKKEDLIALSSYYLSLKLNSDYFSNSIKTYSKIDPRFFSKIILAAKAVTEELIIKIEYQKLTDNITSAYNLKPYKLIESNSNWIIHAIKENETTLKTFYLSRIKNISLTQKKFKKDFIETKSGDIKEIVLKFVPQVEQELYYKIWFEDFEIEKQSDGYIILKTNQPITNRLAAWCISWWDAMKIIEPLELKDIIIQITNAFLKENKA
ncbi:MAG: WYL domain-containing protein [Ignavibacteriales bacterium]|nr:WYL domain-containing protein [Ignavibacteriales bacterium]